MRKYTSILTLSAVMLFAAACGSNSDTQQRRQFPRCELPSFLGNDSDRVSWLALHYWDKFFASAGEFTSDTTSYGGVGTDDFEKAFSGYVNVLPSVPIKVALSAQDSLLKHASPDSVIYRKIVSLSELYLYDPNSPFRNEEFYIPVLESIAENPLSSEDERQRALYQLPLCRLNRIGTIANDFTYTLKTGRTGRMHDIKADWLLLFFSNPGCHNCKEIIEQLSAVREVDSMIDEGALAVLNVYPDEDLSEWYGYLSNYPEKWITAFDAGGVLRSNTVYNLRAIPSLYLLDGQKRVIFKDAPLEIILNYLVWSGSRD